MTFIDCRIFRAVPTTGIAVQTSHVEETCCHGEGVAKVALTFAHDRGWLGRRSRGGFACEDCLGESVVDEIVWIDLAARDRILAEYEPARQRYEARAADAGLAFVEFLSDRPRGGDQRQAQA